jgi:hypothetical protein
VRVMSLDTPSAAVLYGGRAHLHGFLRGLGKARLEILTGRGWRPLARIHPTPDGRFSATVVALRSTQLRLAYNTVTGSNVSLNVAPRLNVRRDGLKLRAVVSPRLPLQVQRLERTTWKLVAHATGSFDRKLRPGSYRVAVLGGRAYAPLVSRPVGLHARATGP